MATVATQHRSLASDSPGPTALCPSTAVKEKAPMLIDKMPGIIILYTL